MEVTFINESNGEGKAVYAIKGRIDSGNAAQFEEELMGLYEQHKDVGASLDFKGVEYISSAGLRVLLKLKKKCDGVTIVNVSSEVYEIFEVTGFSEILDIQKALREINIDETQMIAKGGQGEVYRFGDDEIVKLFSNRTPYKLIENEKEYAKSAFVSGVPTAIPFDIVTCRGRYGLVFEMVKADVIAKKFQGDQADFDEYSVKYADLFSSLREIELDKNVFSNIKDMYMDYAGRLDGWYSEDKIEKIKKFINDIPEGNTMIHGDYHTNNVMIQGDELLIIDMAEISYGHPIFDLASSYFVHVINANRAPESVPKYLGITAEMAHKLWDVIMRIYFKTDDKELIDRYNRIIEGACMFKMALLPAIYVNAPDETKKGFAEAAEHGFFPRMDEILEEIKGLPV